MVDEVMYTAYRLPQFVYLNTGIPEGAPIYGVRVRDRVGRAARITAPGHDAPSATVSETLVPQPMHDYGLDAEWSISELRGAMMGGTPLDTESIEAAVTGSLETMEAVGLTGGGYEGATGLLNHPITGDDAVTHVHAGGEHDVRRPDERADPQPDQRADLGGHRRLAGDPRPEHQHRDDGLPPRRAVRPADDERYIGDNAERTLMRSIMEDNPWTHFTKGQPIAIERVIELDSALNPGSTSDRMIVGLKHQRVAEMGVSISPRVLRVMDKGRVICAQVESKFSELFVKRASTIHYVDAI